MASSQQPSGWQNGSGPPGGTTSFPKQPGVAPSAATSTAPGTIPSPNLRPPSAIQPHVGAHPGGQAFVPPGLPVRPGAVSGHPMPYGMPQQGMWRPPHMMEAPAANVMRPASASGAQQPAAAVKCEWTEHTAPDLRKYYYNARSKTSVWHKPKAFADAEFEAQAAKVIADCPWKEHKAPDGRPYFHNRTLGKSVWKIPEELAAAQAEAAMIRLQISGAATGSAPAAAAHSGASQANPEPKKTGEFMYATAEEAKIAFKAMLTHLQAPQDMKWDKISAQIERAGDPRFNALKANGQRASCYKEWLAEQRAAAQRAEEAAAAQRRVAFAAMLDSKAALLIGARFSKVEALFFEDPRFEALPEAQRQSVFNDWQADRRRKAEEEECAAIEAKKQRFKDLLKERQENPETALTAGSSWVQVEAAVSQDVAYQECPAPGRLRVWLAFLSQLVSDEKKQWEEEDSARYRKERKHRDAFRALLKKHREQGILKAKTRWRRYRDIIRKEPEYLCMETNLTGSRPRELFADVVSDLDDRFNQDAVKVKAALRAAEFTVSRDTDWTDFLAALDPPEMQQRLTGVSDANVRLCYEEMWNRENQKRATSETQRRALKHELARKMKKAADFVRMDMEWSEAQRLMLDNGFTILNDMDPRDSEQVWQEWVLRQSSKEKERKHKRDKRDRHRGERDGGAERDHHRDRNRDRDRDRDKERDRGDRRRAEGDAAPAHGSKNREGDGDEERSAKRARLSSSPCPAGEEALVAGKAKDETGDRLSEEGDVKRTSGGDVEEDQMRTSASTWN